MDNTTEWQRNRDGAVLVSASRGPSPQLTLEKWARWQTVIDARMRTQLGLLEVLEEYLLVELRTRYQQGNVDSHYIATLLDTVLQRMVDQTPLDYEEQRDAPYRWPGADLGFAAERRDTVAQMVEGRSRASSTTTRITCDDIGGWQSMIPPLKRPSASSSPAIQRQSTRCSNPIDWPQWTLKHCARRSRS